MSIHVQEWRLDFPHDAEAAYRAAVHLAERGEPFEFYVDYQKRIARIVRYEASYLAALNVTFSSNGVRIRVGKKLAKEDAERLFMAALISKYSLYSALEKLIQMPLLVDVTVW